MILRSLILGLVSSTIFIACNQSSSGRANPAPGTPPPRPGTSVIDSSTGREIVPTVYEGADGYNERELDPYVALNEYGTWEDIGQQKYFIPRGIDAKWQPYQNGSWSFDEELGWSFVSQDKWGWLTEHNGIWRHHNRHGWIWRPFPDNHYEPSVVTWFDDDSADYVGWYPYSEEYKDLYAPGFDLGFDDGFWEGGYAAVISLGFNPPPRFIRQLPIATAPFRMGIVLINRADVTRPNIFRYVVRNADTIRGIALRAHTNERIRRGLIGRHPGGDRLRSLAYIQNRAPKFQAHVGRRETIKSRGGATIFQPPRGPRPTPANRSNEQQRPNEHQRSPAPNTPRPAGPNTPMKTPSFRTQSPPQTPAASVNDRQQNDRQQKDRAPEAPQAKEPFTFKRAKPDDAKPIRERETIPERIRRKTL